MLMTRETFLREWEMRVYTFAAAAKANLQRKNVTSAATRGYDVHYFVRAKFDKGREEI